MDTTGLLLVFILGLVAGILLSVMFGLAIARRDLRAIKKELNERDLANKLKNNLPEDQ